MATTTVYPHRERLRRQREIAKPAENGWTRAIDSVVDLFVPGAGLKRRAQRAAIRELFAFGSGTARPRSRVSGPWTGIGESADAALLPHLPDLRARSRELVADNGLAAAAVSTHTLNVVGDAGIRVQSRPDIEALGISPEQGAEFTKNAERAWRRWNRWCETTGRLDLAGLQELAVRSVLEDGEAILVRTKPKKNPRRPYNLSFDLVDADRLESPMGSDTDRIRSGIALDEEDGSPSTYYVRVGHPNDGHYSYPVLKWREIPARDSEGRPNILHSYIMRRSHQSRGAPLLAPVLNLFRDLEKLQEATVVRERIAACFAAMISTADPEGMAAMASRERGVDEQRIEDIYPGLVGYLQPGEQVTFGTPTGLAQPYAELVKGIVVQLAAACDLPYVLLTKDFSQLNFSSARAALLEARRMFRRLQHLLTVSVLTPMWELLLEEAWLRGELGDIDFYADREAWCRANWVPPGWGWVDPVKEVQASATAIEKGLSTYAEECAALGRDWEETFEQQARERERREELGLSPVAAAPSGAPADPDEDDDDEKEAA